MPCRETRPGLTQADYDSFGIPRQVQAMFQIYGSAPIITPATWRGYRRSGAWTALSAGSFGNKYERQQSHNLVGSITKISGKWTLKFGADFRNLLSNYQDLEESAARVSFGELQLWRQLHLPVCDCRRQLGCPEYFGAATRLLQCSAVYRGGRLVHPAGRERYSGTVAKILRAVLSK